jgi:hypothetical protein
MKEGIGVQRRWVGGPVTARSASAGASGIIIQHARGEAGKPIHLQRECA